MSFWNTLNKTHQGILVWNRNKGLHTIKKHVYKEKKETTSVVIALFLDKKFCNCFNFVPCILWDFIVLGLVSCWWRIKLEIKNQCNFTVGSRVARKKGSHKKGTWEAHARSWRVMPSCQFRECLTGKAFLWNTHEMFCLEDFKSDFLTLHLYYIFNTHTHLLERELLILSEKSL